MDARFVEWVSAHRDFCADDDRGEPHAGGHPHEERDPVSPATPGDIVILGLDTRIQAQSTASSSRATRPTESSGATRRVPVSGSPLR